jgi:hypothetical protein
MNRFAFLVLAILLFTAQQKVAAQILGEYPVTTVYAGGNAVINPIAAPVGVVKTVATVSPSFKGVLTVDPANGVLRVTNAQPAGSFVITVRGFNAAGSPSQPKFLTLNVLRQGCSNFAASNFNTAAGSPFATTGFPNTPTIFDFNNDGAQDIFTASFQTGTNITLLAGNNTGAFPTATQFANGGGSAQFASVGDLNGDGLVDVVNSNATASSGLRILLNNGAGGFSSSPIVFPSQTTRGSTIADFNGDGINDVAVSIGTGNGIAILIGKNDGTFTQAPNSPILLGNNSATIAKGFFNNDQNIDLAFASSGSNQVYVLLGNGDGTFTQAVGSPYTVGTAPTNISAADFNNDGNVDLLTDNINSNNVSVLLGNGTGAFTPAPNSPIAVGVNPFGSSVADFNGDGRQDFIVSDSQTSGTIGTQVRLFLGNGDGTFTAAGTVNNLSAPRGLATGDFDQNGFLDFAIAERNGNRLTSILGNCAAIIAPANLPTATEQNFYLATVSVQPSGNYIYSANNLPVGLTMNFNGTISGTPAVAGNFIVDVMATENPPLPFAANQSTVHDAPGDQIYKQFLLRVNSLLAANVSVGGRVLTDSGRGLNRAVVTITDRRGATRATTTSAFGYFRFADVRAGEVYTVNVNSKRFVYLPQIVNVIGQLEDLEFRPEREN